MKWRLQSNPIILWLWILIIVLIPMIIFYVWFGEFNLSKSNWIYAQNQATPYFWYPVNKSDFSSAYDNWVQELPQVYHDYFNQLKSVPTTTAGYNAAGILAPINNMAVTEPVSSFFRFPFAIVNNISVLWWFVFLLGHISVFIVYHVIYRIFKKVPLLTTEIYAFITSFWLVMVTIFYSGAFPGFNQDFNTAWYVIVIRIIFILIAGFVGFFFPFRLHLHYSNYFYGLSYYEGLKSFKEAEDKYNKEKVALPKTKQERTFITIEDDTENKGK